jgi:hypothetical protein
MISIRRPLAALLAALFIFAPIGPVQGGSGELTSRVEIETRIFPYSPAYSEQDDAIVSPSVAIQPEFRFESDNGRNKVAVVPFLRWDLYDDKRTHADLRTLSWTYRARNWELISGVDKVFWGVTESRHLVDVINQTDLVENLDGEDKLGQPMVNFNLLTRAGSLGLFVLPGFRKRTFQDYQARLRGVSQILGDEARFESGAEEYHIDFAARWAQTLGAFDVGVGHFQGTGREPRMLSEVRSGRSVFIPFYDQINQTGVDAQATIGDWLFKFEGMTRSGQGDRFFAASGGFEYTLVGLFGTRADLGLLAEYHYDGRDDTAPSSSFDNDIYFGTRLVFNDTQSTEFLAGAVTDQRNQATFVNFEAQRRIGDDWKLEMEVRLYLNASDTDIGFYGVRRDDNFLLRLSRFF